MATIPESQKRLYLDLNKAKKDLRSALSNGDQAMQETLRIKIDQITEKITADNFKGNFHGR